MLIFDMTFEFVGVRLVRPVVQDIGFFHADNLCDLHNNVQVIKESTNYITRLSVSFLSLKYNELGLLSIGKIVALAVPVRQNGLNYFTALVSNTV